MKKITILFLLFGINLFGQQYLTPQLKKSFGLNNHTNRDIPFFSEVDNEGNIIVVGTTERDSTFTDVKVLKLSPDLQLIWEKRFTGPTNLSYDTPTDIGIDSQNNIFITGTSNLQGEGDLFVAKYNSDGTAAWNVNIQNTVNTNNPYIAKGCSALDPDGTIHLIYGKANSTNTAFVYYADTINPQGVTTNSYTINNLVDTFNSSFTGLGSRFFYHNNKFYMIYRRHRISPNLYEHFIRVIDAANTLDIPLNPSINISDTNNFTDGQLVFDNEDNFYLSYDSSAKTSIKIIKFSPMGTILYNVYTPVGFEKKIALPYINQSGNFSILNNSKVSAAASNDVNLLTFDNSGALLTDLTVNGTYAEKCKRFSDGTVMVQSSGDSLSLFDQSMGLITTFSIGNNILTDFVKLDNSTVIQLKFSYAKMYPASDFYSQLDIIAEKKSATQLIGSYTFSGEGTSRVFASQIMVDKADNYLIAYHEKIGEDNYSIGGTEAPMRRFITKYDTNLNIMWTLELPYFIVNPYVDKNYIFDDSNNLYLYVRNSDYTVFRLLKISNQGTILYDVVVPMTARSIFLGQNNDVVLVSTRVDNTTTFTPEMFVKKFNAADGSLMASSTIPGEVFLGSYLAANGDSYMYVYYLDNSTSVEQKIYIYKNMALFTTRPLNMYGANGGVQTPCAIDTSGTLYYYSSYNITYKFNKLTLNGILSSVSVNESLARFQLLDNGKFFGMTPSGKIKIFNNNFTLFSESTATYSVSHVFDAGNYVFINTYYDNIVKAFDMNATLIDTFKLPMFLSTLYCNKDSQGNLILSGTNSGQINLHPEYSWQRGFIHKYNMENFLDVTDVPNELTDTVSIYPNPCSEIIHVKKNGETITRLEIYDITGRLVAISEQSETNISNLNKGIYLIRAYTANNEFYTKKILKK